MEDMLDNLDFEDVSEGELEAEEARGGMWLYKIVCYRYLTNAEHFTL